MARYGSTDKIHVDWSHSKGDRLVRCFCGNKQNCGGWRWVPRDSPDAAAAYQRTLAEHDACARNAIAATVA